MKQADRQARSPLIKEARRQFLLSQENLARELEISFVTINRSGNSHVKPSKLARAHFDAFCSSIIKIENTLEHQNDENRTQ